MVGAIYNEFDLIKKITIKVLNSSTYKFRKKKDLILIIYKYNENRNGKIIKTCPLYNENSFD